MWFSTHPSRASTSSGRSRRPVRGAPRARRRSRSATSMAPIGPRDAPARERSPLGLAATSWPSVAHAPVDGARLADPRRPEDVRDRSSRASAEALPRPSGRAGLGGGDGGDAAAAATPRRRAAADAGTAVEPAARRGPAGRGRAGRGRGRPPKPVAALRAGRRSSRKKIPLWVMPVLAFLPLWAIIYVNTLSKPPSTVLDPARRRRRPSTPASCASCHQADGSGGAGRRPLRCSRRRGRSRPSPTSPTSSSSCSWAATGTGADGTRLRQPEPAGRPAQRRSATTATPMPTFKGAITQTELLEVVRHERETFGGEKVPAEQIAPAGDAAVAQRQADAQRLRRARRPRRQADVRRRRQAGEPDAGRRARRVADVGRRQRLDRSRVAAEPTRPRCTATRRLGHDHDRPARPAGTRHDVLVIGGGPGRGGDRLLAGRGRPRRRVRREEAVPPGEDLRRRAHARGRCTSSTRWAWPTGSTDFHRYDGLRAVAHGIDPRAEVAGAPDLPEPRLRRAPPRPRHDGRRARGEGRGRRCCRAPRPSARSLRDGLVTGAVVKDKEQRRSPARSTPATS